MGDASVNIGDMLAGKYRVERKLGQGAMGVVLGARKAAEVRMQEATARTAGAGALSFAQNASVRAKFEALKGNKAG